MQTQTISLSATTTEPTNPHGDGGYIPILDGWRAIAILLVLAFHGLDNLDQTSTPHLAALTAFSSRIGALGVLIFFSISGYLITNRLLRESRARGTFSLRAFFIKRLFRIIPPLAVYLTTLLALFSFGFITLRMGDWAAPFFLTNYISGASWYTTHFWSLSVEEHFYLFWPICALLVGWRRAMWVGLTLIVAVAAWRPWELLHVQHPARALQHTDMRLDYIMMGCVVALATEYYPLAARSLKTLGSDLNLFILFLLLLLSTRFSLFDVRSVQAAIITLMVCASAVANSRLPRLLLTHRAVLFIGQISYSLYIWQQLFLAPTSSPFWQAPISLPLKYGAAFLAAYLSYRFVETPFIRYGRSFVRKHKNSSPTVGILRQPSSFN